MAVIFCGKCGYVFTNPIDYLVHRDWCDKLKVDDLIRRQPKEEKG